MITALAFATNLDNSSFLILRLLINREPATQICPVDANIADTCAFTTLSISASSNTIKGGVPKTVGQ